MKVRLTVCLLIIGLVTTFAGGAWAFNVKDFPASSVAAETKKISDFFDRASANDPNRENTRFVISSVLFSITAKYMGQTRDISPAARGDIKAYGEDILRQHIDHLFAKELLFRDADGREYWFPIQNYFYDAFFKEYRDNAYVVLYLVPVAMTYKEGQKSFTIVIDEFAVK